MNQEWIQLQKPFLLPSDATVTTNDSGQRNYLFTYAGKKSYVPAEYVKDGRVYTAPLECSECALKAMAQKSNGFSTSSDLIGDLVKNPQIKEWAPVIVAGALLAGIVLYGKS